MLSSSYLGTVLDKYAAAVALVAKFSLVVDGTINEAIWAYQRINVNAALDGAIVPDISEDIDIMGNRFTMILPRQAEGVAEAHEVCASIDRAAVGFWITIGLGGCCSEQGCKSESIFHC